MQAQKTLAVSACLLGENVRYDGQSKKHDIAISLSDNFKLIPFCPEVAVGMAVPRKPVQLVDTEVGVRVFGVEDTQQDVTELLENYANDYDLDAVCGVVLKARSPSCGLNSTPIYSSKNEFLRIGSGMFAGIIRKKWPEIPMIEETDLEDKHKFELFLQKIDEL